MLRFIATLMLPLGAPARKTNASFLSNEKASLLARNTARSYQNHIKVNLFLLSIEKNSLRLLEAENYQRSIAEIHLWVKGFLNTTLHISFLNPCLKCCHRQKNEKCFAINSPILRHLQLGNGFANGNSQILLYKTTHYMISL